MASTVYNPFTKKLDYVGSSGGSTYALVEEGTSFPVSPAVGQEFFNTDTLTLSIYTSLGWVDVATSTAPSQAFITNLGDFYIDNSGDYLIYN